MQCLFEISCSSEDIFFQTSTSFKRSKAANQNSVPSAEPNSPNNLVSSTADRPSDSVRSGRMPSEGIAEEADYVEVDRCLCSESPEDNNKGYEELTSRLQKVSGIQ